MPSTTVVSRFLFYFLLYFFRVGREKVRRIGYVCSGRERRDGPRNKSRSPAREDLPPDPLTGAFQATRAPRICTPVPLLCSKISSALRRNFQVDRQRASSGRQQHHSACVCVCVNWEVEEWIVGEGRLSHGGAERKYVISTGLRHFVVHLRRLGLNLV